MILSERDDESLAIHYQGCAFETQVFLFKSLILRPENRIRHFYPISLTRQSSLVQLIPEHRPISQWRRVTASHPSNSPPTPPQAYRSPPPGHT